jgi:hypothetical protein
MVEENEQWGNLTLGNIPEDVWNDPVKLSKILKSYSAKKRWKNEDYRDIMSSSQKKRWEDPDFRNKILSTITSEDHRKMVSDNTRGKNNPFYKGAVIGTNIKTGEKIIFDGNEQITAAGFSPGHISSCLIGARDSHGGYTWERENVEYEKKIRIKKEVDPKIAEKNPRYKGEVIGTNIETGEEIILKGTKEMVDAGFTPSKISQCISGQRKSHKGYTWRRETLEKE